MINDVLITPLDIIDAPDGNVLHGMKETDAGFSGFGEAYFSDIKLGSIKAWKRHREMTLNLVVPFGEIRFVLFDDRKELGSHFQEIIVSRSNYCRLTVPPMIWMGFQGLSASGSMLLNIANIVHNSAEVDKKDINEIRFNWSV